MTPYRTEKPVLPCRGAGSLYGGIVRRGNPLFCRSQKNLTGQQSRTPLSRTGNDPRQNRKIGAPMRGRRFFIWGYRAAGESSVLPEKSDRAADPGHLRPERGNELIQNRKTGAPIRGCRFFIWGIEQQGKPLFCRSRKNTTGQQSRTPPSRTGNDPRQNRKTGVPMQGCRFFFMMDSQRRASQKQDCSAWVIPSLRCRERDFSLSVKICAKGILPWLKCRSIMKLSRS